ncbi:hypothetical protein [Sphingobium sp.]|uniref:hypothetical protein n=1 Tax=Sphingobium sp. TaxID=1912891 RepID=UPI002C916414|nr:hypothetical protein [Sphingobium sp.]HUD90129.1 hypothetical protein [Sphingobium sp.]
MHSGLINRTYRSWHGRQLTGFMTPENVKTEREMLRIEALGRGGTLPPLTPAEAGGQSSVRCASRLRRVSTGRMTCDAGYCPARLGRPGRGAAGACRACQDHHGSGRHACEAERRGLTVVARAPTAIAAQVRGDALGR